MKGMNIKSILLAIALASAATASAQQEPGTFSVIPRVGLALANTSDKLFSEGAFGFNKEPLSTSFKPGVAAGADVEYQVGRMASVSVGAYYAMQGAKFDEGEYATEDKHKYVGIGDMRTELQYVNVPVMLNMYVARGLAVKAGVQLGFCVGAKYEWDETDIQKDDDGMKTYGETKTVTTDIKYNKVDVSIPLGVSYEYMNVILDARYNFGLTGVINGIPSDENIKNKVITFTVGYRFAL